MTALTEIKQTNFDVVCAFDNALPHLSSDDLLLALAAIKSRLKPNGRFAASIRDYDSLILSRPEIQQPSFFGEGLAQRFVHQVWDWLDDRRYTVHLYITAVSNGGSWTCQHFVSDYKCLLRDELAHALKLTGFSDVRWIMPSESGYYQPLVICRAGQNKATAAST